MIEYTDEQHDSLIRGHRKQLADAQATVEALRAQLESANALLHKKNCAIGRAEAALDAERDRLAELVGQAQPHVCSLLCPSVKARHELWTHTKLCLNMQAALTPAGGGQHE
jgi:hypothetical protein